MGHGSSLATCWDVLPKVSRSFALPIRLLPRPAGDAVMLSYLVFRIADTIEDCCPDAERRARLFGRFRRLIEGDASAAPELATIGPPPYDALMRHASNVAEVFARLPAEVRSLLLGRLDEMSSGMQGWSAREVRTTDDLHDYCYYVAGVVGKLLTRIFRAYGHVGNGTFEELDRRAVEFGIALQLINVIRDVRGDAREGRRYWPTALLERRGLTWDRFFDGSSRAAAREVLHELVRDALQHCDAAFEYVTLLPPHQFRIRAFCLLPLFMAMATMRACLDDPALFEDGPPVKIRRAETRRILALSVGLAPFDGALSIWYRGLRNPLTRAARNGMLSS
ncbi:MAG: squalene/phytoene synthase family protein [Planctomycetes bacterium]|nr:squalene/phytoene synthase family protein [Planctomycetota bacterium]